jgi:hypothetical protein
MTCMSVAAHKYNSKHHLHSSLELELCDVLPNSCMLLLSPQS